MTSRWQSTLGLSEQEWESRAEGERDLLESFVFLVDWSPSVVWLWERTRGKCSLTAGVRLLLDKIICGEVRRLHYFIFFCACAACSVHRLPAGRACVPPLIKRPPARNVGLRRVRLDPSATQKLFLTCTLCSIWPRSGGGRRGGRSGERKQELGAISPVSVCFLSRKTKVVSVLCSTGFALYSAAIPSVNFSTKGETWYVSKQNIRC